ncbi:Glycerol-3-phosphate dehydrogenase-like protein [Rozella allomycis CSF55]|uniref:Glycerol-3-phosphate dehydrogenase [NAD(+)] n=1 Tax=Rozella allomycis (strain CSF55) TaxID=988480 RepID=A0A075B4R5_ROZAC|nr:Glycerol-3-phosphate dehydrogenase-like protein [Rozella allomycis CSF55]|eukprot:EPZ36414.1 Glycerol-3-phosphate dehydrogenase-like protein [Rozella allomycis CSF55]
MIVYFIFKSWYEVPVTSKNPKVLWNGKGVYYWLWKLVRDEYENKRGSAIAKIVGNSVLKYPQVFQPVVPMWVFEEIVEGKNHFNRYLPNIKLPGNIVAVPDIVETVRNATILIFVVPHQIKNVVSRNAKAISLIKGIDVNVGGGIVLISEVIKDSLSVDVSVLMGANIANEVAQEKFCEATIGIYKLVSIILGYADKNNANVFQQLFHTDYFRINVVNDVAGVELCGALKNIVATAAGFADGLRMGDNTKAAIIRIGLLEMRRFCKMFYKGIRDETFFESCGVADLITTCAGGRNRRLAEAKALTGKVK